eukprot:1902823-Prymnesium_polylepis.1
MPYRGEHASKTPNRGTHIYYVLELAHLPTVWQPIHGPSVRAGGVHPGVRGHTARVRCVATGAREACGAVRAHTRSSRHCRANARSTPHSPLRREA